MERFLVRNQVPKPDPGIADRAAKAKKHRKLEKLIDATLFKRKKLEKRSSYLHDYPEEKPTVENRRNDMVSYPYNVRKGGVYGQMIGKTADNKDRQLDKVIRAQRRGEGHLGFAEFVGHEPATERFMIARPGSRYQEAREEKPATTKFWRPSGLRGANQRKWDERANGEHQRSLEQQKHLTHPRAKPLVVGLVQKRFNDIEGI